MRIKNITGEKFNRLLVIKLNSINKRGAVWECLCDCGNKTKASRYDLISGNTKSCGCLKKEIANARKTQKGLSTTRSYAVWSRMNDRCNNKNNDKYKYYGGRGINVCERWRIFVNFIEDMGMCPANMQIDRIDNEKGYFKDNCRWVTVKEQMNNRRNNRVLNIDGEKLTMTQASEKFGVKVGTIWKRLESGWNDDVAAKTKVCRG